MSKDLKRILIAIQDADLAEMLRRLLFPEGFGIIRAAFDSNDSFQIATKAGMDLVICNIGHNGEGIEFHKRVEAVCEAPKFFMVSGGLTGLYEQYAEEHGIALFQLPLDLPRFVEAVRQQLA